MSGEIPSPEFLSRKLQEQDYLDRKKRRKYTPGTISRTPQENEQLKSALLQGKSQGKTYEEISQEIGGISAKQLQSFANGHGLTELFPPPPKKRLGIRRGKRQA